jgi:Abortive infection alpha
MSESGSPGDDLVTTFAKEIAAKLPVEAVLAPAAKPAGQLFSDIVKTIQLALAPLQFTAAFQDRLRNFIDTSVRRIPEEKRVPPAPQILGPIIEGVRYEPEGTPIDEMFSELLSRSMDRDRVNEAHPAYPIIIKQLSSDEAKILARLNGRTYDRVLVHPFNEKMLLPFGEAKMEVDELPRDGLDFPNNVKFYMEHLKLLGLAGIFDAGTPEGIPGGDIPPTGVRIRSHYRLTDFGQHFVTACVSTTRDSS